ncbi:MAG TPA: hypothetical protein DER26_03455 [Verrucomicrobia bacterium]|nr:hypothetical protein [Verrucomicrobiota bacterium]
MSRPVCRPARSLRSEILALLLASAVPGAVFLLVYLSVRSLPRSLNPWPAEREPFGSLICLKPEQERAALRAIRSAWRPSLAEVRAHAVDLSVLDLPESRPESVLALRDCVQNAPQPPACRLPRPLPLSLAAPPPRRIGPQPQADELRAGPFARAELLKTDD